MKIKKIDSQYSPIQYVVHLEKDEEIIGALKQVATNQNITFGLFFGMGMSRNLTLGYFDAHNKDYIKKTFAGEYELSGFSGYISTFGKNRGWNIQCHVTITDSNCNAVGGHLFEGTVSTICEIFITRPTGYLVSRKDETTGLNVLDI